MRYVFRALHDDKPSQSAWNELKIVFVKVEVHFSQK